MTAPHDGARGDARKRHDAPTCLVCGNSVPVDASALAAAKAEGRREAITEGLTAFDMGEPAQWAWRHRWPDDYSAALGGAV